jgi:hypothetical protein
MAGPRDAGDLAMKRPVWFWIAIAYLVATVTYNLWLQGTFLLYFPLERLDVIANLSLKIIAIVLLLSKRGEGVYFLAAAFLIGLLGTIWEFYQEASWLALTLAMKISRISGFIISLAIVIYMGLLKKRRVLKSAI